MGGILSRMKDGLWGLLNAPNTEEVDETMGDEDWYDDDEPVERDDNWEASTARSPYDYEPRRSTSKRPQTTARQSHNNKVLEMYGKSEVGQEIILRHPVDVGEAAKICDNIRDNKICVINLTGMERGMAQRIADFLGGACYAVNGTIQRVSKDIFIIVPDGVRITGELKDELEKDGYVLPKAHGMRR